jgi:hypothetical protein
MFFCLFFVGLFIVVIGRVYIVINIQQLNIVLEMLYCDIIDQFQCINSIVKPKYLEYKAYSALASAFASSAFGASSPSSSFLIASPSATPASLFLSCFFPHSVEGFSDFFSTEADSK